MKSIISFVVTLAIVTLTLYSFFYWKSLFYALIFLFIIVFASVLLLVLSIVKRMTQQQYINRQTKNKLKKVTSKKLNDSFVFIKTLEKVTGEEDKLFRIILEKYVNKEEKETLILDIKEENPTNILKNKNSILVNKKEVLSKVIEFKQNLPLLAMTNYDLALLIYDNNNYNRLGDNNLVFTTLMKGNQKYLKEFQSAYIHNGWLSSSYKKVINLYIKILNEKSDF